MCINLIAHEQEDKETGEAGVGEGEKEIKEEGEVVERVCVEREEDEVDLRRYRPAGGPIVLNILELPAPPKNVGQWTIRRGIVDNIHTHTHTYTLLYITHTHTHTHSPSCIRRFADVCLSSGALESHLSTNSQRIRREY